MTLPRSLEELRGLRAARWIRESTAGQYDAFGPDAQREQQDRAVERYGLVDVGLAWQVAHSGRTVGTTTQFTAMMAAAGVEYDVLVVGYVSRFARDLRTAVNARHDLHAAGAAILFADERILTSDDEAWDSWAREAVEAESYSRKLARRIREGYAAKRRRLGEPGGRPPFGFSRTGRPPRLEPAREDCERVRRCYELAVAGNPDREVARALALPLDTVRGILTNPIYVGRLRDGSPASVEAVIDVATWQRVQQLRAVRNRRAGRPAVNRTYLLPMLACAFCGAGLKGDTGRYRHVGEPCADFLAHRPRRAWKNQLRRRGASYAKARFEDLVGPLLRDVGAALQESALVEAAADYSSQYSQPVNEVALRRLQRRRTDALTHYAAGRDMRALEQRMAELDAEEQQLRTQTPADVAWPEVLAVLRDLPGMWEAASASERRSLAGELIDAAEAIGGRGLRVTLWSGVQAVAMVGARGFGPTITITRIPTELQRVQSA